MIKSRLLYLLLLFFTACGVSKDRYQDQVMRTQELGAREADLTSRLNSSIGQIEMLEFALEKNQDKLQELDNKQKQFLDKNADLDAQLKRLTSSEISLKTEVAGLRKEKAALESSMEAVLGELKQERSEGQQVKNVLEECRGDLSDLKAQADVLGEQKNQAEREKKEKLDEISKTYEDLLEGMKEEVSKGRVTISQLKGKLTVNLLDEIIFDSGSAAVKPDGRGVLERLGELLGNLKDKLIVVEGHTDNVPIRGDLAKRFPTNWELSTARATSVVRYLEEKVGIPPTRLSAVGFGSNRPIGPNDTPEGRAMNRRIELKLVPAAAPMLADKKNDDFSDNNIVFDSQD